MSPDEVLKRIHRTMEHAAQDPKFSETLKKDAAGIIESREGVSVSDLRSAAGAVGRTLNVEPRDANLLYSLGQYLHHYQLDHVAAIDVYLETLRKAAHLPEIYRNLIEIYNYAFDTVNEFDFIANALQQFEAPSADIDPKFYCLSYTYIGKLYEYLGRFPEASYAFSLTETYRTDDFDCANIARHAEDEIAFVAETCAFRDDEWVASAKAMGKKPLIHSVVFMGEDQRNLFDTISGPSFFTDKTLTEIDKFWHPLLIVMCPIFEQISLRGTPFFKDLSEKIRIRFIRIPRNLIDSYPENPPEGARYHPAMADAISSLGQLCVAEIARRHQADLVSIPPDAVFSSVAGKVLAHHSRGNAEVIFTPGVNLHREQAIRALQEVSTQTKRGEIPDLPPSTLSQVAVRNLHPATKAYVLDGKMLTHPGMLWWRVEEGGMVGHCFQMHPIFIAATALSRAEMRRFDSFDEDFVPSLLPDPDSWEGIHVIADQDETIMFNLTSGGAVNVPRVFDPQNLPGPAANWVSSVMRPLNFWLFGHEIRFGDATDQAWENRKQSKASMLLRFEALCPDVPNVPSTKAGASGSIVESPNVTQLINKLSESSEAKEFNYRPSKRIPKSLADLKVIYSVVVWGDSYVDNFLSISLPSLLSQDNLANLPNNHNSLFLIHTRPSDVRIFERSPHFQALKNLMPIKFLEVNLDASIYPDKYSILNAAQSQAIQRARDFDAIIFAYADFVWGDGAVRNGLTRLANGNDAVVMPVPPLVFEDFSEFLERNTEECFDFDAGYAQLNISFRKLVEIGKKIMHPMMRDNIIGLDNNTVNPAYVLWAGPHDDLLIRCFHIHPLVLRVQNENPVFWQPFLGTLDEEFVPRVLKASDRVYFVTDSDEAAVVSLTERSLPVSYFPPGYSLNAYYISRWAEALAAPLHKMAFDEQCVWHSEDVDHDAWKPAMAESNRLASHVKTLLLMPDSVIRGENNLSWLARDSRIKRFSEKRVVVNPSGITQTKSRGMRPRIANFIPQRYGDLAQLPFKLLLLEILARIVRKVPLRLRRRALNLLPGRLVLKIKAIRRTALLRLQRQDPRFATTEFLFRIPIRDLMFALFFSLVNKKQ